MSFIQNIDPIKVQVRRSFLFNSPDEMNFENAYLIAVKSVPNRPLFFTVHLESGALFSNLPINALKCLRYGSVNQEYYLLEHLQPFSCTQGDINVIKYSHLKDCPAVVKDLGPGTYLMTIDYLGEGLSEDPEQAKTHNIIVLESGLLCAVPNNHVLFLDGFFTTNKEAIPPKYQRQTTYFSGPA